jgi:hypothetical protein
MAKKRRRILPLNYPLQVPDVPESGPFEDRLKAFFHKVFMIQEQGKRTLEGLRLDYEETGNPLSAWDAYQFARSGNVPLPTWVLKHLDGTAKRLLDVKNSKDDLSWCFGFDTTGGPGPWKQYWWGKIRRAAIAFVIERINARDPRPIADIFDDASEELKMSWGENIDWETISQWFYRNSKKWKKGPVRGCTARAGYPTLIMKENHGLADWNIVTISGATGKNADLVNGKDAVIRYATRCTLAVEIDTTGAEPMGGNITLTP